MSSDLVIDVRGLIKSYQIYDSPRARLKQFILPRLQRLFGLGGARYFDEFHALQGIDFQVKKGETVGIVGRNGSGKSTLLQVICGTLAPSQGSVRTYGRVAALLELGSGFNPEFTGRENVYLNGAVLGLSQRDIEERYDAIVRFADIGTFIDQPIKTYSSGMVVRLAFATAIHVDPDILIVDEALAVGDTAFQQKCLNRIRQMQRSGVSILLVTHSSNALIEYCDRGIFLKHGHMMMDGPCREVVKAYADDLVEDEGGITILATSALDGVESKVAEGVGTTTVDVQAPATTQPMVIESTQLLGADNRPCATVKFGDIIQVSVRIRINENIEEPCFGVQLSSVDGIALWSATTQSMDKRPPPMAPGIYTFHWNLSINCSGNRYVVALGVGQILNGEYRRHHRLDYAGHFDVIPLQHMGSGWLCPLPQFSAPVMAL